MGGVVDNSDEKLLKLIASDNENALEVLIDRYMEPLCKFSFSILNSKEEAEEVVADVFIKLWQNRRSIVLQGELKNYLFSAVKNQSLNYIKKNAKHKHLDVEKPELIQLYSSYEADSALCFDELQDNIKALLSTLPRQQKIVLSLHGIDGFSLDEIATILNISKNTAYNHLHLAVKFIANKFNSVL
ncbi:MAG: RNA polymerase sigma factor [Cyclobacteriaceae bacterium]